MDLLEKIVSLSKRRGFLFPSSDIYGGLGATYDYGPLGVELKRNVMERWWREMVYRHEEIEGIDAAILMHPAVWKASGHVDAFNDPMIDDKASKRRYRADELIEHHLQVVEARGDEERAGALRERFIAALHGEDVPKELYRIIVDEKIRAPDSGAFDWTEVRQFNLMFETHVGPLANEESRVYLRPETAQGIFVNFRLAQETTRQQVPFGLAQIGKAFRNEIVARRFIFRMREFEQMEMQYFVRPGTQMEHFEAWREKRMRWHVDNGIRSDKLRWHEHEKLAHYADAAFDVQYEFPMGWQEIEGIHSRTNFDLGRHQEFSGKKLEYFDPRSREKYIPYVVETSAGLDRTILMLLCEAYGEEAVGGEKRVVMRFHPHVAPIKAAVFPLVKRDGMEEIARAMASGLRSRFNVSYDDGGSIGKRYRRMDEAGTPFCITIDGGTLEDGTVTVRDRDSMDQDRVSKDHVEAYVQDRMTAWVR